MSAVPTFEQILPKWGPLPDEVFNWEPRLAETGEHPIPSQIDLQGGEESEADTFSLETDEEGRLIAIRADGNEEPIFRRSWDSPSTYTDIYEGRRRELKREGGTILGVYGPRGGELAKGWTRLDLETRPEQRIVEARAKGKGAWIERRSLTGPVIDEVHMRSLKGERTAKPQSTYVWEYDEKTGLLVAFDKFAGYAPQEGEEERTPDYRERYMRLPDGSISIIGGDLTDNGFKQRIAQIREYDDQRRVTRIESATTSAAGRMAGVRTVKLALSYA